MKPALIYINLALLAVTANGLSVLPSIEHFKEKLGHWLRYDIDIRIDWAKRSLLTDQGDRVSSLGGIVALTEDLNQDGIEDLLTLSPNSVLSMMLPTETPSPPSLPWYWHLLHPFSQVPTTKPDITNNGAHHHAIAGDVHLTTVHVWEGVGTSFEWLATWQSRWNWLLFQFGMRDFVQNNRVIDYKKKGIIDVASGMREALRRHSLGLTEPTVMKNDILTQLASSNISITGVMRVLRDHYRTSGVLPMSDLRFVIAHPLILPTTPPSTQLTYSIIDYLYDPTVDKWVFGWSSAIEAPLGEETLWSHGDAAWNGVYAAMPIPVDLNNDLQNDLLVFGDGNTTTSMGVLLNTALTERGAFVLDTHLEHYLNLNDNPNGKRFREGDFRPFVNGQSVVVDLNNDGIADIVLDVSLGGGDNTTRALYALTGMAVYNDIRPLCHGYEDLGAQLECLRPTRPLFDLSTIVVPLPLVTSNIEFSDVNGDGWVDLTYASCSVEVKEEEMPVCQDSYDIIRVINNGPRVAASSQHNLRHPWWDGFSLWDPPSVSRVLTKPEDVAWFHSVSQKAIGTPFNHGATIGSIQLVDVDFDGCPELIIPLHGDGSRISIQVFHNELCATNSQTTNITHAWRESHLFKNIEHTDHLPSGLASVTVVYTGHSYLPSLLLNSLKDAVIFTPQNSLSENSFLIVEAEVSSSPPKDATTTRHSIQTDTPPGTTIRLDLNPLVPNERFANRVLVQRSRPLALIGMGGAGSSHRTITGMGRIGTYVEKLHYQMGNVKKTFSSGIVPNARVHIEFCPSNQTTHWNIFSTIPASRQISSIVTISLTFLLLLSLLIRCTTSNLSQKGIRECSKMM